MVTALPGARNNISQNNQTEDLILHLDSNGLFLPKFIAKIPLPKLKITNDDFMLLWPFWNRNSSFKECLRLKCLVFTFCWIEVGVMGCHRPTPKHLALK